MRHEAQAHRITLFREEQKSAHQVDSEINAVKMVLKILSTRSLLTYLGLVVGPIIMPHSVTVSRFFRFRFIATIVRYMAMMFFFQSVFAQSFHHAKSNKC